MIVILDYRMGNAGSVRNMCNRLGIAATVSRDPDVIASADKLILPGVGHFSRCIEGIDALGLRALLTRHVIDEGKPILGVCMGMQVMMQGSEEGPGEGLGWIQGWTRKIQVDADARGRMPKVPHMGWGYVQPAKPHPLTANLPADPRFYFVHSYAVDCTDDQDVLLRSHYAGHAFVSAFARGNIAGVQFHVEKSHIFGMRMLASFAAWDGRN